MTKIIISRIDEVPNRMRDYRLYIDGQKVGTISNGTRKEFDVLPGRHLLCVKIDWAGSPEMPFEIIGNKAAVFKVSASKKLNWLAPVCIGLTLAPFIMKHSPYAEYRYLVGIPVLLFLVYYIGVGRHRYLLLTEMSG